MSVLLVRIDDRLVHGQVVEGWVKHLKVTQVTVVSDLLVNNWARKTVMGLALPEGVGLDVVSTEQIAKRGELNKVKDSSTEIILFASPTDVLQAINKGLQIATLNLGGMHHFNGNKKLTTNISLNKEDIKALKCLLDIGINIKVCALPKDKAIDLIDML